MVVNGSACGGAHGKWYHGESAAGASHSVVVTAEKQGPGLYEVYLAPVHPAGGEAGSVSKDGMVMVDPGSNTNFVRHDFAAALGLRRETCQFKLKVVDREARAIDTARYLLQLEDKDGNYHEVLAMGLDEVTTLPPDPNLSPVQALVQHLPAAVLDRPQGQVDILLGLKNSALHGRTTQEWGNLRLLESPLGCGWSLRGTHRDLTYPTARMSPSLSADAYTLGQAISQEDEEMNVFHLQSYPEFHELDELGTAPPPVCLRCKGCRECTFRRKRLTPEEQEVVTRVEKEMKVDSITGIVTAAYPWKKCVRRMMDNRWQAQKVQETMERHMLEVGDSPRVHGGDAEVDRRGEGEATDARGDA